MERYRIIDEKMTSGYEHLTHGETQKACDVWLEAWEDIKSIMAEAGITYIDELQEKYKWTDFLSNYMQDLEAELNNAGLENKEYFRKRIKYCEEMLSVCGKDNDLIIENTRRAIADSHFELGNEEECNRLYNMWLESDPNWGWGYIGWSDCYHFGTDKSKAHLKKAEEIITRALEQKNLRDRLDVAERAVEIYQDADNGQKAAEIRREIPSLKREIPNPEPDTSAINTYNTPVKVEKTGRNDPCPCGSGKKYKKCCGNA